MVARMKAIVPKKRGAGAANQRKRIELGYERFIGILENDLNQFVKTWKKKPTFRIVRKRQGRDEVIGVFTDDMRWIWIGQGTKPYIIRPRKAKALRFKSGYSPATAPNRVIARPAQSFGDTVHAQEVHHPGIKARKFDERLVKRNEKKFRAFMNDAIKE